MRKFTKAFSLALSALMMLGAAVGIKPMVERASASDLSYSKVTSSSSIEKDDICYIYCPDSSVGVTGYNSSDATVSSKESDWEEFIVTQVSSTTYSLKASSTNKWITLNASNKFTIAQTSSTQLRFDENGYLSYVDNNNETRYLCKNGTYYRCYKSIGNYSPFYVYKKNVNTNDVTISFDSNGGSGTMDDVTIEKGSEFEVPECTFTKEYYTFACWGDAADLNDCSEFYDPSDIIENVTEDFTLYAFWDIDNRYVTVSFDPNGGKGSTMGNLTILKDTDNQLPTSKFTKDGYKFVSWNTKSDGTGTSYNDGDTINISENITLYAQYALLDVSSLSGTFNETDYYRIKAKVILVSSSNYYVFDGQGYGLVYEDKNSTAKVSTLEPSVDVGSYIDVTGKQKIYNGVKEFYTLTYAGICTDLDIADPSPITGSSNINDSNLGHLFTLSNVKITGAASSNWYPTNITNFKVGGNNDTNCEGYENLSNGNTVNVTGVLIKYSSTYEIVCKNVEMATSYTVTFDKNGATSADIPAQTVFSGLTATQPANPTRTDHNFLGWYLDDGDGVFGEGDTLYDFSTPITSSITLIAGWKQRSEAEINLQSNLDKTVNQMALGYKYETNTPIVDPDYSLVTSESDLADGDSIVIVQKIKDDDKYYALTNSVSNNKFSRSEITFANNKISENNVNSNITWKLGKDSSGKWTLMDANFKYLSVGSSDANLVEGKTNVVFVDLKNGNFAFGYSSSRIMMLRGDTYNVFKNYAASNFGNETYANEAYIFVKKDNSTKMTDVEFRMMLGVVNIENVISGLDNSLLTAYGISMTSDIGKNYDFNFKTFTTYEDEGEEGENITYVVLKLGDVLNNIDRIDDEFTIKTYVTYEGMTYYSTSFKKHSVKSMVLDYVTNGSDDVKAQVTPLYNLLTSLGVYAA